MWFSLSSNIVLHVNVKQIKHDILSRFIELGDDPESSFSNDKSLRDVVLNFVIAGRDTTATTLSWFIYMIVTHPTVAEKLYDELKAFEKERANEEKIQVVSYDVNDPKSFRDRISSFARLLNYDSLGRLVYLHACITETLRLYPAVPQVDLLPMLVDHSLSWYLFSVVQIYVDCWHLVTRIDDLNCVIRTQKAYWKMMFSLMEPN